MQLSALAQAGLDRFRQAFAASRDLPDEVLLARRSQQLRLPPPSRAPRARDKRPAPPPSRQYMRATSTRVLLDQRLTPNAARLAGLIVAFAGGRGRAETTKAILARRLGLHPRTIGRLLAELRAYGYIASEATTNRRGSVTGLRIRVLFPLIPYYLIDLAGTTNEPPPKEDSYESSLQEASSRAARATHASSLRRLR